MLKLIYQSILHKKSKVILLMVQFTIGFAALLFGLSCLFNLLQYKESMEEIASLDTVHPYIDESDALVEIDNNKVYEYSDIFKQLKEKNLVERLGLFETIYVYDSPQVADNESRLYSLNHDSLGMSNFTLMEGTMEPLKNDVQSLENIPVVVSAAMKDQYILGETYQLYYVDRHTQQYEKLSINVVGILASSVHFWSGGSTYISESIMANKEFILSPQFKEFEEFLTYEYNSLIQLQKHESEIERDVNLEKIQLLFEQNGINLQYTILQDELDSYYETQKVVIVGTVTFAAILLILSLLGCIGAILASITTRYREFGIYYSLGFTKNHMIRLVYGEIIAIFGISFIIATISCKTLFATLLADEALTMNLSVIAIAFIIMIICIILTTIMPFIKLKKIEPIEMIKGVNR